MFRAHVANNEVGNASKSACFSPLAEDGPRPRPLTHFRGSASLKPETSTEANFHNRDSRVERTALVLCGSLLRTGPCIMIRCAKTAGCLLLIWASTISGGAGLYAQQPPAATPATTPPAATAPAATPPAAPAGPEQVVVRREPLIILAPDKYRASMHLEAARVIQIVAPISGQIRSVSIQPGDKATPQLELARFDDAEVLLRLSRAEAQSKIAKAEQAAGGNAELNKAKQDAADADLNLAKLALERAVIRAPINAEVREVFVVPGQFVAAGQPMVELADTSVLKVNVPVDRRQAAVGQNVEVRVESETVPAKVRQLLPLDRRFDSLRELFETAASAVAIIENPSGKFLDGQTAYSPLVPRQPVAEVPSACVGNLAGGGRKVQVVRENVVRDVAVQLLGSVGPERVYVSGPFAERDEAIISSSRELADGTQLRPSAPTDAATARPSTVTAPGTQKSNAAF